MLRWRLLLGTLLIAALVGLCWLDARSGLPGAWLMPVALTAAVLATREVLDLAERAQLHPLRWTVYGGNVLAVLGSWLSMLGAVHGCAAGGVGVSLGLGAAVLLVFLGELFRYRQPGGNTANLAAGVFAVVYVGVMLSFAIQLRGYGLGALAAWIVVVKMGDTGAYFTGRLLGRHKLAPRISPGKTAEGAIGALAWSCFGAWLVIRVLGPWIGHNSPTGPWWGWLLFGLLVGTVGLLGDLAESLLKRDVGVKDSSTWLPGFGGVLDILDSLLLSAPVAWCCWTLGWLG
ncbi:MAG: phosphatidate cytidylyltransferase [Planctomycetaceae bacterium]|nr:phosphatidate cytidylyltransferase [Planctomycetaceae bacterium]